MFREKIKELTKEQELEFERNLVWLFGSVRGGTTWVGLQLLSHQTNCINEPHIEEHLSIRANEISKQFVRRIDNPQQNLGYFFSEKYKDVWLYYLRKLLLNRFYAQTKDISRKTIIKEVCSFGGIDVLSECMNDSKIIVLLRDGRDVIDSLVDARSRNGWMSNTGVQTISKNNESSNKEGFFNIPTRHSFIQNHSKLWVVRHENFLKGYDNHSKKLRCIIKYENILKNTFEELKKLYEFIGIDISDDQLQKIVTKFSFENISKKDKGAGKFVRSASPGKWKENFNDQEKQMLNEIMGPMLNKLGYNSQ